MPCTTTEQIVSCLFCEYKILKSLITQIFLGNDSFSAFECLVTLKKANGKSVLGCKRKNSGPAAMTPLPPLTLKLKKKL